MTLRRSRAAAALIGAGLVLSGCVTNAPAAPSSSPMMGGGSSMMDGYTPSSSTCDAPTGLPGNQVEVVLGDMGMTGGMGGTAPSGSRMVLRTDPTTVPAGTVSLLAANRGWRTHELVVLPLAEGASAGQRTPDATGRVSEAGSLGEASAACAAGPGEGTPAGSASWVTLTLPAGRYELVCNLAKHYADGMVAELDVR